jgi:hypothetical protein
LHFFILRLVKRNRDAAVDAIVKFSEVKGELAERTDDDVIRTFASNGVVALRVARINPAISLGCSFMKRSVVASVSNLPKLPN